MNNGTITRQAKGGGRRKSAVLQTRLGKGRGALLRSTLGLSLGLGLLFLPGKATSLRASETEETPPAQNEQSQRHGKSSSPAVTQGAEEQNVSTGMIQTAELNPERPLFVPTHPRVTTTLRFPGQIGAPEGRGFTEDEGKAPGEYLVAWSRGDSHLTVTPLAGAAALNLNIPFRSDTYVVYFYPVERQFQALASLRLTVGGPSQRVEQRTGKNEKATRSGGLPTTKLLGLVDKLKLLRALAPGKGQSQLANTLGLELYCPPLKPKSVSEPRGLDSKKLEIQVSHIARDPAQGALAFALRLTNLSEGPWDLDKEGFSVYCGGIKLRQCLVEGPAWLSPAEETEAFLVIETEKLSPLRAANPWQVHHTINGPVQLNLANGFERAEWGAGQEAAPKQQKP